MKKIISIATLILVLTLLCQSMISCTRNKVDPEAEGLVFDTCLAELEERISKEYQLQDFKLVRLGVDKIKHSKKGCILRIKGTYDENGALETWGKAFDISYDDYLAFFKVAENHIFYNTEITDYYDSLMTDVPAWVIQGVYNIMFD